MIHPHSKNIGIHAYSRNASLVRALMSVSRQLRARSLSMEKRRRFSARKKTSDARYRNFGKASKLTRWNATRGGRRPIFTVILRKFHAGKFHCICRTRRLPKRFNDRLRPISESKHPRYIYIYFYFPINALPSTRSLVQIAYYGSGYVFQVAFFSLLLSSFVLSTKNFTYLNFQILRKFFGVRALLLLYQILSSFRINLSLQIRIYIQIGHNKHPLQNSIRI